MSVVAYEIPELQADSYLQSYKLKVPISLFGVAFNSAEREVLLFQWEFRF